MNNRPGSTFVNTQAYDKDIDRRDTEMRVSAAERAQVTRNTQVDDDY
jgi:hypothetical protein